MSLTRYLVDHLQLGEGNPKLEQVCSIILAPLRMWVVGSCSWVLNVHRKFDRNYPVEHIHGKPNPRLSHGKHCMHIHHGCLIEHDAKVYGLGIHCLRDISRRRTDRGQATYHGLGVSALRVDSKNRSLASLGMHSHKYLTASGKLYRVASALPERSGWWWTVARQLLRWLEH